MPTKIAQKSRHAGMCESFDLFIHTPAGQAASDKNYNNGHMQVYFHTLMV